MSISPESTYPAFPTFFEPVQAETQKRYERQRTNENSSRLAWSMGSFQTKGWGEFIMPQAHIFDCLFVQQPYMMSGFSADHQPERDNDTQLVLTRFPRVSAFVYEYHSDDRGLFYAAHVGFTVDMRSPEFLENQWEGIPNYTLIHYFCFAGVAIKRLDI